MPDFFLSATMYYTAILVSKFRYWHMQTVRSAIGIVKLEGMGYAV